MIRSIGIANVTALGAITAVLWLSPAAAGDQRLPGAPVVRVVAIALNLKVAAAAATTPSALFRRPSLAPSTAPTGFRAVEAVSLVQAKAYAEIERPAGDSL